MCIRDRYSEGDECEFVADDNLQAVFRARRATSPAAQREWVGLTDEEVNQLYTQIEEQVDKHWVDGGTSMMFPTTLYKAIEAKLKEKNNG